MIAMSSSGNNVGQEFCALVDKLVRDILEVLKLTNKWMNASMSEEQMVMKCKEIFRIMRLILSERNEFVCLYKGHRIWDKSKYVNSILFNVLLFVL